MAEQGGLGAKKLNRARRPGGQARQATGLCNHAGAQDGAHDACKIGRHLGHEHPDAVFQAGPRRVQRGKRLCKSLNGGEVGRVKIGSQTGLRRRRLVQGGKNTRPISVLGHEACKRSGIAHHAPGLGSVQGVPLAQAFDKKVGAPDKVVHRPHLLGKDAIFLGVACGQLFANAHERRLVQVAPVAAFGERHALEGKGRLRLPSDLFEVLRDGGHIGSVSPKRTRHAWATRASRLSETAGHATLRPYSNVA